MKSARGATAIPRRGDHTRNMFGTSLHTTYCKQTIALETAERMQAFFNHCELLRRMNYCTNYCDSKQLLQRHPLRNPPLLRTPKRPRLRLSSQPKLRDSLRLGQDFNAHQKKARDFLRPQEARFSSVKKIASKPRFLLRRKWVKMVLVAEFLRFPRLQ